MIDIYRGSRNVITAVTVRIVTVDDREVYVI